MFQAVLFEVVNGGRARSYEAYMSLNDIPQLRQFVQAVLSQKLTQSCDTRIVLDFEERSLPFISMTKGILHFFCVRHHFPQFVVRKGASLFAHPAGVIKDGSRRV